MTDRSKSPVSEIEKLLECKLPSHLVTLLLGPTNTYKEIYTYQFLRSALKSGKYVYYIASKWAPKFILRNLEALKFDVSKWKDRLYFIDLYHSARLKFQASSSHILIPRNDTSCLGGLIRDIIDERDGHAVFTGDPISEYLEILEVRLMFRFLRIMLDVLRENNCSTLFTLESGFFDTETVEAICYLFDIIFETTFIEKSGEFKIRVRYHPYVPSIRKWISYIPTPQGITFPPP
jgi:KaiC/GvpD/RAD55 family RecA-like ATPase